MNGRWLPRITATTLALAFANLMPQTGHASSDERTYRRIAEGYEIRIPIVCQVQEAENRLTAICPADNPRTTTAETAAPGETFTFEVKTTPIPIGDFLMPSPQLALEMAKAVCGEKAAAKAYARVDISFSVGRWPAHDGFVRCSGRGLLKARRASSTVRFAMSPKLAYWLITRASHRARHAAYTTAAQTFHLSFKPLSE